MYIGYFFIIFVELERVGADGCHDVDGREREINDFCNNYTLDRRKQQR